jgi:hypothetical protein
MQTHDTVPLVENYGYQLNGVTYLPHYRNDAFFVGPGYPRHNSAVYTKEELSLSGANKVALMLWSRGKTGIVNNLKP